jgi:hypothetical protein
VDVGPSCFESLGWAGDLSVDIVVTVLLVVVFSDGVSVQVVRLFYYGWLIGLGTWRRPP